MDRDRAQRALAMALAARFGGEMVQRTGTLGGDFDGLYVELSPSHAIAVRRWQAVSAIDVLARLR